MTIIGKKKFPVFRPVQIHGVCQSLEKFHYKARLQKLTNHSCSRVVGSLNFIWCYKFSQSMQGRRNPWTSSYWTAKLSFFSDKCPAWPLIHLHLIWVKLKQPTGERLCKVMTQEKKINGANNIFIIWGSNLYSKYFDFILLILNWTYSFAPVYSDAPEMRAIVTNDRSIIFNQLGAKNFLK